MLLSALQPGRAGAVQHCVPGAAGRPAAVQQPAAHQSLPARAGADTQARITIYSPTSCCTAKTTKWRCD